MRKAEVDDLTGRILGGRFRLTKSLGAGGFGQVYLAHQMSMDREVAVKIIHPRLARDRTVVSRFEREARLASKLQHPNTVVYFDFGQDGDLLFLAMEYVSGQRLDRLLRKEKRLAVPRAAHLARQICGSLQEAHDLGLVHRDLKPSNVLVTNRGGDPDFVKVIDFGLAKIVGGDPDSSTIRVTQQGAMLGTPAYMAPEQIRGQPVDNRCDIYALGVLMFVMLTRKRPFQGDSPQETIHKHLYDTIPSVRQFNQAVPESLDRLVRWCLAKERDQRPTTVGQIHRNLDRFLEGSRGAARGSSRVLPPSQWDEVSDESSAHPTPLARPHVQKGQVLAIAPARGPAKSGAERETLDTMSLSGTPEGEQAGIDVVPVTKRKPSLLVRRGHADLHLRQVDGATSISTEPLPAHGEASELETRRPFQRIHIFAAALAAAMFLALVSGVSLWVAGSRNQRGRLDSVAHPSAVEPAGTGSATDDVSQPQGWREGGSAGDRSIPHERSGVALVDTSQEAEAEADSAEVSRSPGETETESLPPSQHGSAWAQQSTQMERGDNQSTEPSGNEMADVVSSRSERRSTEPARSESRSDDRQGRLRVTAIPWGDVFCNGERLGRTPIDRSMAPGYYECTVRGAGGRVSQTQFHLEAGGSETVRVNFNP